MRIQKGHVIWVSLTALYFFTRLINLKIIPIFTDEAIYAHWAQIALNDPTNRYLSLEDGKQPLFIWLAAILQKLIEDPLIASRLVSVTAGFGSLVGIHLLAKKAFNLNTARFAAFLYILLPFTLLYDRLALFDSLLTMLCIWIIYFSLNLAKTPKLDLALLNGFAIGLGLITKSSASFFLYLLPFSLIPFKLTLKKIIKWSPYAVVSFVLSQLIYNALRLSPLFYMIERKNYTFIRTAQEVLDKPFQYFYSNGFSLISWLVSYTTLPLILLFVLTAIIGIYKKERMIIYFLILITAPLTAEMLFNKVLYARFTLFYYPFIIILIAKAPDYLKIKLSKKYVYVLLLALLILPAITSFALLTNPAKAKIPDNDSNQLFNDWPSGYGVEEIVKMLKAQNSEEQVYVGTEGTFGLLPFALNIYLNDYKNIHISSYWPVDSNKLPTEILDLSKNGSAFFIFNESQKEITNKRLELKGKYQKGVGNSYMRIYKVKPL